MTDSQKNEYIRPQKTYTDNLTDEEIVKKLEDYKKVESINEIKQKSHIRYFLLEVDKKKGTLTRKFRMGGFVVKVDLENKYVMLSTGKTSWSVQYDNAILYRKMTTNEIKEEYENDLEKLQHSNEKLLKKLGKISKAYDELEVENTKLKKALSKLGYKI